MFQGDGHGGFTLLAEPYTDLPNGPGSLTIADVNKDGKLDALTISFDSELSVQLGDELGGFSKTATYNINDGGFAKSLALCDINGDDNLDVLTTCSSASFNAVGIMLGDGKGNFAAAPTGYPQTGTFSLPNGVAVGDVNGDGKLDALVANFGSSTLGVLLNGVALATRTTLPGVTVSLAPNPATSSATLRLAGLPASMTHVQAILLDATGRVVRQQALPVGQGSAEVVG